MSQKAIEAVRMSKKTVLHSMRSEDGRYSAVLDELSGTTRKPFIVRLFIDGYPGERLPCRSKKAARRKMEHWIRKGERAL